MKPAALLFLFVITAINIYIGSTDYSCRKSVDKYLPKCGSTSTVRVFKDMENYYIELCPIFNQRCLNFMTLRCSSIFYVCDYYLNLEG